MPAAQISTPACGPLPARAGKSACCGQVSGALKIFRRDPRKKEPRVLVAPWNWYPLLDGQHLSHLRTDYEKVTGRISSRRSEETIASRLSFVFALSFERERACLPVENIMRAKRLYKVLQVHLVRTRWLCTHGDISQKKREREISLVRVFSMELISVNLLRFHRSTIIRGSRDGDAQWVRF